MCGSDNLVAGVFGIIGKKRVAGQRKKVGTDCDC